jgi:hypothetical protein
VFRLGHAAPVVTPARRQHGDRLRSESGDGRSKVPRAPKTPLTP